MIKPDRMTDEITLHRMRIPENTRRTSGSSIVMFWDFEANGLIPRTATRDDVAAVKPFEVGIVVAEYNSGSGKLLGVIDRISCMEDIREPIMPEIVALTGVTNEDIKGHHFNDEEIIKYIDVADIHIAHNANYDAKIAQCRFPAMAGAKWGCSMTDVDWMEFAKIDSKKLKYIVTYMAGEFYEAHRALVDAEAVYRILSHEEAALTAMPELLSRITSYIIVCAIHAPYAVKDNLRMSGYSWHPGGKLMGRSVNKCWFKMIDKEVKDEEEDVAISITGVSPMMFEIPASQRFVV